MIWKIIWAVPLLLPYARVVPFRARYSLGPAGFGYRPTLQATTALQYSKGNYEIGIGKTDNPYFKVVGSIHLTTYDYLNDNW